MRKNHRVISFILVVLLVFGIMPVSSYADDFSEKENIAVQFLTAMAENEWLEKQNDLLKYVDKESPNAMFAVDRTDILSQFRSLKETSKTDFKASYTVEYSGPRNFETVVRLIENISFLENEHLNHYNNTYIVLINDSNKITDVQKLNDWYEAAYKDSGKTKEIIFSELTREFINNMEPDVSGLKTKSIFKNTGSVNTSLINYDVNNAVNYALTYSGNSSAYYNTNFNNYMDRGGDCMNFASQTIYAGLGGNNIPDITTYPLFKNLELPNNEDIWKFNTSTWVGVNSFQSYITSTVPKDNGLVAQTWRVEADQWDLADAGIDQELLLGSIVLVPGLSPVTEFGHAIVITEVNGTTRDLIKYCGHTSNRNQAVLGKDFSSVPMLIIRPIYYKTTHECLFGEHMYHSITGLVSGDGSTCIWCGFNRLSITNKLFAPVTIGETITLASKASMNVFKMSICVEDPDGEITWMRDEYNTNFIKRQLSLMKPGLYKITTYAQDVNDILSLEAYEESSSYYIRVGGADTSNLPGDSEYIDSNYFDDELNIDFIPTFSE